MRPPLFAMCSNAFAARSNTSTLQQQVVGGGARRDHFWKAVAHNSKWLPWITEEIRKTACGWMTACKFVLIHFPKGEKSAQAADAYLMRHGVILRGVASYGLPDVCA